MRSKIPMADSFHSGIVELDNMTDLKPGDMVRFDKNGGATEKYELLSVCSDGSVIVDTGGREIPKRLSEEDFSNILKGVNPDVWTILNRSVHPIEDSDCESLVLFSYAFSNERISSDDLMIAVLWSVTNQNPVKMMPSVDGTISSLRFDMLREALSTGRTSKGVSTPDSSLKRLYDEFNDDVLSEVLDQFVVVSEFNATKLLDFRTETTFDRDTKSRLERDAESIEEHTENT